MLCVLAVISIEAPVGYFFGTYNWTEYVHTSVNIRAGDTTVHYLTVAPLDSVRIAMKFQGSAVIGAILFMPKETYIQCQGIEDCSEARNWPNLIGPPFELTYTSVNGGEFVWFATAANAAGPVPGVALVTVSRVYLAVVPAMIAVLLLVALKRTRKLPSGLRTRPAFVHPPGGRVAVSRFCMNCGSPLRASAVYCTKCGSKQ
jgi:hypothetical protein